MKNKLLSQKNIDSIESDLPFHNYKEYQEYASLLEWSSYQSDLNYLIG